ncbi:MAG TPA: glycosyltransferase family 1 protein [Opitutaceae bacterium]|nr:glycosyltransferase family 1 protein [Opitutaceae bacterium]
MKLALVTETYPPEINGVAMTLNRLATGLVARGHSVEVVRPRQKSEKRASGNQFLDTNGVAHWLVPGMAIPMYRSLRMGLPVTLSLRRRWRTTLPDVVHVATEGPLGLAALYSANRLGLPVTSTFHTNFHQYGGHYGLQAGQHVALRYLRWFHNRTRRTMVPTHQMLQRLEQDGFRELSVLARGVDARLFSPEKRSVELRRTWGATDADPVVIYVGRMAAEKNLGLAVQAFLKIQECTPNAKFVLVGDGPEKEPLRAKYPHFQYAGSRRDEELAAHYASADLFIFPSTTETFGNVVTEAMASGLVVLSYDYAAARQYIRDEANGYVARFNDSEDLLRRALEVMSERLRWPEIRAAARETALSITWDSIIDTFESALLEARGVIEAPASV